MKIVKEDTNLIILKENILGLVVIGFLFLAFGVLVLANIIKLQQSVGLRIFLGSVISLLGILAIILPSNRTITLDKMQKTLAIADKRLIKNSFQQYPFTDIKSLDLVWSLDTETTSHHTRTVLTCMLFLVLKNGQEIQFSRSKSRQNAAYKEIGTKISSLTGIPYIERTPPALPQKPRVTINGMGI